MSGSVIHYRGIPWEVNGTKDGKGVITYRNARIQWCQVRECFQFIQGEEKILYRQLRSDCIRDATEVLLLDQLAEKFAPSWENIEWPAEKSASTSTTARRTTTLPYGLKATL